MVIRYIKNLINELVKLRKDSIKLDYLKALDNRPDTKDKYLKRWITNILTSLSPQAQTQGGNLNLGASINISNFNTISNNEQIFDNSNVGSRNANYNFQNPSMTMSQSFVENKNNFDTNSGMYIGNNIESLIAYKNKLQQSNVLIFF